MFVARWQIDARFGQKQTVIDLMRQMGGARSARRSGSPRWSSRCSTGSIGAREATIEANHKVESLAQLEQFFEAIGKIEAHTALGQGAGAARGLGHVPLADPPGAVGDDGGGITGAAGLGTGGGGPRPPCKGCTVSP